MAEEWSVDPPGGIAVKKRHTLKELRDRYVVKQELDYSCGAAALATHMRYYYGDDTSEREILDLLMARLRALPRADSLRKQQTGFSLLDLKIVAEQKGYKAAGFELSLDQLGKLVAPVVVYVRPLGYDHFAVLRGVAGDRVLLADPARGNLSMSTSRFAEEYGGVIFALGRKGEEAIEGHRLDFRTSVLYAARFCSLPCEAGEGQGGGEGISRHDAWSAPERPDPLPTLPRPQKARTGEGVLSWCCPLPCVV